ncbi:hypothetical protein [Streptomyces fulvoviolaceus]|uniref:hypothetical protein n=1 Tax=Streptomyces fulvoviolaceus TaxID=285535 RepID=UPI0004CC35CD|nr:hypothetical protein [Streptomyces fulvoviolaceus]MCT9084732.1 hypothetical protein [Streptomyces fulvoviolaceus]
MKSLKAAAVVAGSVALVGAAAPAFAYNTADITPTSLNGAVNTLTSGQLRPVDVMPLQHQSDALDTENKDSVLNTVKGATNTLNSSGLIGGLPLGG